MEAVCRLLMDYILSACVRCSAEWTGLLYSHFAKLKPDDTRPPYFALLCICAAHHVRVTQPPLLTPFISDTAYPILVCCCGLS